MNTRRRAGLLAGALLSLLLLAGAGPAGSREPRPELLIYCGITMVRPIKELVEHFERSEQVRIHVAQGGSEDLYQSARKSRQGDLYLAGSPSYRRQYLEEGLLGDFVTVGYNRLAILVRKGNPKGIRPDPRELLRRDVSVLIGNAESGSVGRAAREMLTALGIYDQVVEKAIFLAPDSRGLNAAMKRGEADAVLNWRATAWFPDVAPVVDVVDLDPDLARPEPLQLNLLTFSRSPAVARKFMRYAVSREGQAIFRRYGFLPLLSRHAGP